MLDNHANNNIHRFLMHNSKLFNDRSVKYIMTQIQYKFFDNETFYEKLEDIFDIVQDYCSLEQLAEIPGYKKEWKNRVHLYRESKNIFDLKNKYREIAKLYDVSFKFMQQKNALLCYDNNDTHILTMEFHAFQGVGTISYRLQEGEVDANVMLFALNYFVDYACMTDISKINLKSFSKFPQHKQTYIEQVSKFIGFEKTPGKVQLTPHNYKLDVKLRNNKAIDTILEILFGLEFLSIIRPAFHWDNRAYNWSSLYQFVPAKGFFHVHIDWLGFNGMLRIGSEDYKMYIEIANNDNDNQILNLDKMHFLSGEFVYKLNELLKEIDEKLVFPNTLEPPTNNLRKFIFDAVGADEQTDDVMNAFLDRGYDFVKVEEEAAKLLKDRFYLNKHRQTTPKYSLKLEQAISEEIYEFLDHYIVLIRPKTLKQDNVKFTVAETYEEASHKLVELASEYTSKTI